jgi:predicted glycoside hydrolase/deacetylase ChbG (UPF0249 family)
MTIVTATGRKRVVIHEDDVGMTHGANTAFVELCELGTCSSGSIMVPCPWFPEAVEIAGTKPALDLGVHLTLTSEQVSYRWRPLTAPPPSAGLTDEFGFFWAGVPDARKAEPDAVEAELRAQLDTALSAGIDVTHLDAHMGTAQMPEFVSIFRRLGHEYKVPVLLVKELDNYNPASYAGDIDPADYDAEVAAARAAGEPIFDIVLETPWERATDARTAYREMFAAIPDGLSYLSLHFNRAYEAEGFSPEGARIRSEEYDLFRTGQIGEWVQEFDLDVIGMKTLRDELQTRPA